MNVAFQHSGCVLDCWVSITHTFCPTPTGMREKYKRGGNRPIYTHLPPTTSLTLKSGFDAREFNSRHIVKRIFLLLEPLQHGVLLSSHRGDDLGAFITRGVPDSW